MKKVSGIRLSDFFIACILGLIFCSCSTHNWPQFRGSEGNMVVSGGNLPDRWDSTFNIRWTFPVPGAGYSSPVIWQDKVFITSAFAEKDVSGAKHTSPPNPPGNRPAMGQNPPHAPQAPEDEKSYLEDVYRWEVTCLDLKTGRELWKQVAYRGTPRIKKHPMNTYANETPVTDGKRVIAYFGMTGVFCYNMNGGLVWQKDLGAFPTQRDWGAGSSPVLYNDILFLKVDNDSASFLVALDAATGEEKWRVEREEKTTYSTPLIWKNKFRTELVTTGKTARSYDPATGKLIWELKMEGESSIPSPVGNMELLFLGNAGGREVPAVLCAVRAGVKGDITPTERDSVSYGVQWSLKSTTLGNPSPLLFRGKLYVMATRGGELQCVDAGSGVQIYREKIDSVAACWASPWAIGDRICILDEKGVTHVIKTGEKPEVVARNRLNDKFWPSVAISRNVYIFKGAGKLYCVGK
jgi:outer membrane protein assembly factor BamB